MKLVEQHIIKPTDKRYKDLCDILSKAKDLYNTAVFVIRQHYFNINNQKFTEDICSDSPYHYINYFEMNRRLKATNNKCYRALPANTSQEVLKCVDRNWKSFFALLKAKQKGEYTENVNFPQYLKKQKYFHVVYNRMTLNQNHSKTGIVRLPKTNIEFKIVHKNIQQIRFIPCTGFIAMEVVYEQPEKQPKSDNKRYASIDLGVNNIAAVSSNVIKSFIINGKPVKSINQYYNKAKARKQSILPNGVYTSKAIQRLGLKRNSKIKDYLHKASNYIVNQLVDNEINTLIIGKNNHWKQETNIRSINNQNFVCIPHSTFINMLCYKCQLHGINVILTEESYTSKASFFDNDDIPVYGDNIDNYKSSGKRIYRGLYKDSSGYCINADINGALNIMRKYLNVASDWIIPLRSRGLVARPNRVSFC